MAICSALLSVTAKCLCLKQQGSEGVDPSEASLYMQAALYCVFDGHIGRKCASSCTKLLPEELRSRVDSLKLQMDNGQGMGKAWEEVFLATDDALVEAGSTEDGTTATAVLVWTDAAGNTCLQVCSSPQAKTVSGNLIRDLLLINPCLIFASIADRDTRLSGCLSSLEDCAGSAWYPSSTVDLAEAEDDAVTRQRSFMFERPAWAPFMKGAGIRSVAEWLLRCTQSANVGDSAAVFCSAEQNPRDSFRKMTVDHRISDPGEKRRLAAMGIELGKDKTRLYGLNLSRCLGDHFIKTADLGFIAVPSVSEVVRLRPQESGLLVIASDGLWDVAEPGRVMQVRSMQPDSVELDPVHRSC